MQTKEAKSVVIPCNHCGTKNKVTVDHLGDKVICGSCKKEVDIVKKPVSVTQKDFQKEVLDYPGLVLVDFWATWCPPCKMIAPILESIASEKAGLVKIVKVDTDKEQFLAMNYEISSIPTLILFNNGAKVKQISGAMPKAQLLNWIGL
jgi:thioredoxin